MIIQGWTLNYEAFFYVLFCVILFIPARVNAGLRLVSLTAGLSGLVLIGLALRPGTIAAVTYTSPLLLEFLAGAWLCHLWQRGLLPKGRAAAIILAVGVLTFAVQVRMEPGPWRVATWGLPALLVAAGCLGIETAGRLPHVPGLRTLGDASYAIYLTHLLVQRPLLPVLHRFPTLVALPTVMIACIAAGLVVHRFVERPLHRWMTPATVRHPGSRQAAAGSSGA